MSDEVNVYTSGPVCCSACVPKDMATEEVERIVNLKNPSGISSVWKISQDPTFSGGEPNPCTCEADSDRVHYLLNC